MNKSNYKYFLDHFKKLKIQKGDNILVYSDSGSSFNYKAKERFKDYIEILNVSNFGN